MSLVIDWLTHTVVICLLKLLTNLSGAVFNLHVSEIVIFDTLLGQNCNQVLLETDI